MKVILLDMGEGFRIIGTALLGIEGILILISLLLYRVFAKRQPRSLLAAISTFIITLLFLEGSCFYRYLTDPTFKSDAFILAFKLAVILSIFPVFLIFVISIIRNFYGGNQE